MASRFAINGRFLTRKTTGVDRYAREIVRELDRIVREDEAAIVVPRKVGLVDSPSFEHIEVIVTGDNSGHVWEQVDFSRFLQRSGLYGVNLCNSAPMRNPGLVCIHDMNVRANPHYFSKWFAGYYRLMFGCLTARAERIVSVSQFSKNEIVKYYPKANNKVFVVPNAWQHISRIDSDEGYLNALGIESGSYYFALSSLAPNKNLRWIVETALLNPTELFLVAGGINERVFGDFDIPQADNVVYLGYVSDGQIKALMQGCKEFLFPTFYEGFGIPPMEALACRARAAVSDTPVMHEVYGSSVRYLDPLKPDTGIGCLSDGDLRSPADDVLRRYSWTDSARMLLELIPR